MNIFVVGATGYVGLPLCEALLAAGHQVRALCRSEAKAAPLKALGITCISGDLSDVESLRRGMEGCQQAYHLAAFASAWHKNPQVFYDINVQGTLNVLEAALSTGLEKVVLTSTAGVIGASPSAQSSVHEASNPNVQPTTLYEITKLKAEREAIAFANRSGLAVTIVNPSRIYGPGQLTESNAATKLIKRCYEGKWRILPGNGESMGNYVYIDDVVQGHLQAMQYGQSGHRYILGGENVSFKEFFGLIRELSPHNKRLYKLPVPIMMGFAHSQLLMAEWFGRHPLIIPAFVRKYNYHWNLSSQKAIQELGYQITPLRQGVMQTIEWFNQNQYERV